MNFEGAMDIIYISMKKSKKKPTTDIGLKKGAGAEAWLDEKNTRGSEPGSKPADKDLPQETWLDKKQGKIRKK
jgi:hypothetical protein